MYNLCFDALVYCILKEYSKNYITLLPLTMLCQSTFKLQFV